MRSAPFGGLSFVFGRGDNDAERAFKIADRKHSDFDDEAFPVFLFPNSAILKDCVAGGVVRLIGAERGERASYRLAVGQNLGK